MIKCVKGFLFVLIGLSLVLSSYSFPRETSTKTADLTIEAKIDRIFEKLDKASTPGASVSVVKDGLVVFRKGYGCAQVEYNIPITPSTIFHVASVSKQFTAMAISMLEARGKLSVDDDIHKYLPYVPDFGKTITIRHLLHHTSGLRDQWELLIMSGWRRDDVITQEQILDTIKKQEELNFPPGDRFMYCNTGYTLLAEIVSGVSGKPFVDWVKENIFDPLGMSSSHFHIDHRVIVKNRAYSYAIDEKKGLQKCVLSYANVGATSLFTTVEDMANWMRNFNEKRVGGEAVIKKMLCKGVLNNGKEIDYARGLGIGVYKGLKTVSHSGGDAGFRSYMVYFPGETFGVVVLSNLASSRPRQLAMQVADIYLADTFKTGKKEEEKKPLKKVKLKKKQLLACIGTFWVETSKRLREIVLEKKTLFYVRSGTNRSTLVPVSVSSFYMKEYPYVAVRFSRPVEKKFTRMKILMLNREPILARRVEPFKPTGEILKEYTGTFYSTELDVKWRLFISGGTLNRKIPRNPKEALKPLIKDFFDVVEGYGTLFFQRDTRGEISGLTINTGRILDMKFKKIE